MELYCLSYDEPDALADFAEAHGISYPLLSDPDSEIIERFGILNTLIPVDDHPWRGIPFPGAYVIDGNGVVTAKFFEHSLAIRPSGRQLLGAALGRVTTGERAAEVATDLARPEAPAEVTVDVSFDVDVMAPGMVYDLTASFTVPEGQHLYGQPVPDGMVAAAIELDDTPGLIVGNPIAPATRSHLLAGTGDRLRIYDGSPTLSLPITHNGNHTTKLDDGSRIVSIAGTVRWQSCDEQACGLPQQRAFGFQVSAGRNVAGDIGRTPQGVPSMNGTEHFKRMSTRRQV